MSAVLGTLTDGAVVARRNLIKVKRVPELLVFTTIQPIMFILLFAYVFGSAIDLPSIDYLEFLIAGMLAQTVVFGATFTGAGIAAYTLWDDHAVTTWALAPVTYFSLGCTLQALAMTPGALRRSRVGAATVGATGTGPARTAGAVLRRSGREIAIVAVLSPLVYVLVLEAMRTTPVALVAPARESGIVVGSLLAWWLFREPDPLRRLLGAAIVLAGITMIVA